MRTAHGVVIVAVALGLACGGPVPSPDPAPAATPDPAPAPEHEATPLALALERAHDGEGLMDSTFRDHDGSPCTTFYDTEPRPIPRIEASSSLTEGAVTHGPERAIDGDTTTAWVEGVDGDGIGETLVLWFDAPGEIPAVLGILPGYARDAKRWRSNNRVRTLLLRWLMIPEAGNQGPFERDDLHHKGWTQVRLTLSEGDDGTVREQAWQYVELGNRFLHDMEIGEVAALELHLLEVDDAGATHDDTCISELQFRYPSTAGKSRCAQGWCKQQGQTHGGCADPI